MTIPSADQLMREAETSTGLNDWGWYDIRTPLDALVRSVNAEGHLHARGELHFRTRIGITLRGNLRMVDDRKKMPEIAREEIRRPIIIPSLPRSGTTILSRLLAQDPATRTPQTWEIFSPSPSPTPETYASNPRIDEVQKMFEDFGYTQRDIMAMHEFDARETEECHWIAEHAMALTGLPAVFNMPSYLAETASINELDVFKIHKEVLQHLQFAMPAKRWVLKCPPFMSRLNGYLATYPDAVFIMTHRDLGRIIPSLAKLMAALRRLSTDDPALADINAFAQGNLVAWKHSLDAMMKFRDQPGMEERCHDVYYADTVSNPIGVVEKIYERFELPLPGAVVDRMRSWLDQNQQGKYGANTYSLADCGLTDADIDSTFKEYMDRYNVPREKRG